jgi:hypothetical protein
MVAVGLLPHSPQFCLKKNLHYGNNNSLTNSIVYLFINKLYIYFQRNSVIHEAYYERSIRKY